MSTAPQFLPRPRSRVPRGVDYPTGDGKPMAETDVHRDLMVDLIQTLEARHAADLDVYVSGNILLFYEEGNGRRHVSPDVLFVRGIEKKRRENYLAWLEGKYPDLVIELTSKTTRSEDVKKKFALYRDVLRVPEYIMFDPLGDYLFPPMQGFRLVDGRYDVIGWVDGRLPSEILGLHLERDGSDLRLVDPATGLRLSTLKEMASEAEAERMRAEAERDRAEAERMRAEAERGRAEQAEAEAAQLRRELEDLRRQAPGAG
jgi:Uma2 family endonuclease